MAYDKKYRERVLEYISEGHTQKEAQEVFKVSPSTIKEWEKLLEETGSLEKREIVRSFKKIDPVKLEAYVKEHPDAYLQEIADAFGCVESAVRKALKRLKITRKKNKTIR
jgi:transposase